MTKEELLEEAKKRYKSGYIIKSDYAIECYASNTLFTLTVDRIYFNGDNIQTTGKGCTSPFIYYRGKWAEIISKPNLNNYYFY